MSSQFEAVQTGMEAARSTGIDRLDVASGGRQHPLSFILWSILTTLTHTHLHQCSVSLVFISQRTPSGLGGSGGAEPKCIIELN